MRQNFFTQPATRNPIMSLIDFILNLAGLLLWLNWRALPLDPLAKAMPATLVGTLRRAEPTRVKRWHFLAALGSLLVLRASFYRLIGPTVDWTGTLNLFATRLAFRSDSFNLMLLYSALSFGLLLGIFMLWLLLLSVLAKDSHENQPLLQLARAHLGFVIGWPAWRKLLVPFLAGLVLWWLLSWPLARWDLIPRPVSETSRLAQSALLGLSTYFAWKYLIVALLAVNLLHNYLYFGRHMIWTFVDETARRLLGPLRSLRVGKVDLAALAGIILVFLFAQFAEHGVRSPTQFDINGKLTTAQENALMGFGADRSMQAGLANMRSAIPTGISNVLSKASEVGGRLNAEINGIGHGSPGQAVIFYHQRNADSRGYRPAYAP